VTVLALLAGPPSALAPGGQAIRKNLPERLPNLPKIDEVSKTPVPGIWEVRLGSEVVYTDEPGQPPSSRASCWTCAPAPTSRSSA
jgi:thiol:disulfide interchange protein DsbC